MKTGGDDTRDIVGRCEATGIELVGVGIFLDMGHIFRRAVRINALGELTPALFAIGRELILPSADAA